MIQLDEISSDRGQLPWPVWCQVDKINRWISVWTVTLITHLLNNTNKIRLIPVVWLRIRFFCTKGYRHVYLEGMATSSIFLHIAIIDLSGKVRDPIKSSHIQISHSCGISPFCCSKTDQAWKCCSSGKKTHSKSSPKTLKEPPEAAFCRLLCPVIRGWTWCRLPKGSGHYVSGQQEWGDVLACS